MKAPLWQITEMPEQAGSARDYVGWLRCRNGVHVKICISDNATQEDALLIIQQFAGILTPAGLEQMISDGGKSRKDSRIQSAGDERRALGGTD